MKNKEKIIDQLEKILTENTNCQFDPDNYNTTNYDAIHDSSFGLVAKKIFNYFSEGKHIDISCEGCKWYKFLPEHCNYCIRNGVNNDFYEPEKGGYNMNIIEK